VDTFVTPKVLEITQSLMAALDTPRALAVKLLLESGEMGQIAQLSCDPTRYRTAERYYRDAVATDLLRKLQVVHPDLDPEATAVRKWWEAEAQCFASNRRLFEIRDFGTLSGAPLDPRLADFIRKVKKNVLRLIGEAPPAVVDGRFGPGATMSDRSRYTTVPNKMSTSPTLTPAALFYLCPWTGTKWAAACAARGDDIRTVVGNHFFTVPKDAKTHRSCAKEPSVNGFYQLGFGRILRKRLKAEGFDLDHGQDVHRRVACAASQSGEFCTIDLSSASDTICRALVELLLPPAWFAALNDLRSPKTYVDGKWVYLEKFSSMGNGFTFELETTLFAAISMAVTSGSPGVDVFVYGDDIIVPSEHSSAVLGALAFFGMTPNVRKTFTAGPFRESCGGDYFNGYSVRAHFLEEIPSEPQQFISFANGVRRISLQFSEMPSVSPSLLSGLRRVWFKCLDQLPSNIRRCRGPERLGDLVIHDDEERWTTRWRSSIRYVRVYRPLRPEGYRLSQFDPDVQFAAALYGVTFNDDGPILGPQGRQRKKWPEGVDHRKVAIRDSVSGYKVGWTPSS
jgi:hypothetical protein